MRALSLDRDLIVFISRAWQTTATAARRGEEGLLIDSPVFGDELEAVSGVLAQSQFPVSGLLCTHADWDHLLGRLAFPSASLGCGASSAERLGREPGAAQRELRAFDERFYAEQRRVLALGDLQRLPVPGELALGEDDCALELHRAEGHTADGTAYWLPWLEVLVCGDYLSPVEIPSIEAGGSVDAYLATLERLRPLVERARTVVPGHGAPLEREAALQLLTEDLAYINALIADGPSAPLPESRRTAAQRA